MMYEGKARRLELIEELKTNSLEKQFTTTQTANIRENEEDLSTNLMQFKETVIKSTLEEMVAMVIGQSLDFLSKELVRIQEQQRIATFVKMAEITRQKREQ